MTDGTKNMLVRLPEKLAEALKREATARGLTVSALVRVILQDGLRKKYSERREREER